VDEVGLIEESTVQSQTTPVRRGDPLHTRQHALKPLHSLEALGCETHLGLEDLDEPAVAETHALRDITDARGVGSAQRVDGDADGAARDPGAGEPSEECPFHDSKCVKETGRGQEPLTKLWARPPPQRLEIRAC
jgi:hypothetical protein